MKYRPRCRFGGNEGGWLCLGDGSDHEECAGGGCQAEPAADGFAGEVGQFIILAQHQITAVQGHYCAAQAGLAGQNIGLCLAGQLQGGGIGEGVVDHQIHTAVLAVLAGVAEHMGAFPDSDAAVVNGGAHQLIPQFYGEVVGPGLKGTVLQETVVGGGQGVASCVSYSMMADAIDYNEWKFGTREEGMIYSLHSFFRKLAQGVGPSIGLVVASALGYVAANGAQQTDEVALAMRYLVAAFYLLAAVLQFVGMKFVYNLDKNTLAVMNKELEARRAE